MVNEAGSGHQGAPLGFADVMSVLFNESMFFAPGNRTRDRLVLSAGHASAALYACIYLTRKTSLSIDDLRWYRKFGAICQGHPEIKVNLGVEMTTGALGQGIATAVGVAIALKKKKIDGKVFVIVGDGCLMEGVSHEAATLAISLNLDNLIVLFDDNDVCIDGFASSYTTDNAARFEAYGFGVFRADGHNYDEIRSSIALAKSSTKPSFIAFKTTIGKMAKNAGTPQCHGKFVSNAEAKEIRKHLGLPEERFSIPDWFVVAHASASKGASDAASEDTSLYVASEFRDELHQEINRLKRRLSKDTTPRSTRHYSGIVLEALTKRFSCLIGGSADLSQSNCTISESSIPISSRNFGGNYIHYGIREHAMGCAMNGLALEGFIPYGGTFLVFSDYMKPALRNAALMRIAPIFILTHDSIAIGEDGATHQPVEQLTSLRSIPNFNVFRPNCGAEVAECLELAICNRTTPSAIVLTKQPVDNLRSEYTPENMSAYGMYEISPYEGGTFSKRVTIVASGSEVSLASDVKRAIQSCCDCRIISAPCLELFDAQSVEYKESILRDDSKKVFIEAGCATEWHRYKTTNDNIVIGVNDFGESGTTAELFAKFGLTAQAIVERVIAGL
jgi:transketolase